MRYREPHGNDGMNKKEISKAWLTDQCDPDNWLSIPEFGVMPQDVFFEGFAFPIVTPQSKDLRARHENIRSLVKFVRSTIRTKFDSLGDVRAAHHRVFDVVFPEDGSDIDEAAMDRLPYADKCASHYVFVMQSLESAMRDFIGVDLAKRTDNAAICLSDSALWIAQWVSGDAAILSASLRKIARSQATRREGKTKLTEAQKYQVRREYKAAVVTYGTIKMLARKFDVSDDTISRIVKP